jgi:hypothetical protein
MKKPIIIKIIIAMGLGLLTPFVFILGAAPFEVTGRTSLAEAVSGSVALACYLAFCQFQVALKDERPGSAARWPVIIALTVPLVAWVVFIACVEEWGTVLTQALPMLAAGICGISVGAVLAARLAAKSKVV